MLNAPNVLDGERETGGSWEGRWTRKMEREKEKECKAEDERNTQTCLSFLYYSLVYISMQHIIRQHTIGNGKSTLA